MENNEKKNHSLIDLMDASMSKIREMGDSNTIIGEPIQTPDGVTLIPVSRLRYGFGCGGGDFGKQTPAMIGGGKIGPLSQKLFDTLTDIQWGRLPDPFGWTDLLPQEE